MRIRIHMNMYRRWRIKEKDSKNGKKGKEERWRKHDRRDAGNRVVSWRVEGAYKMRFPRAVPSSNFWSWRPLAAHPSARLDAFNYPWNIVNYSASEQVRARLGSSKHTNLVVPCTNSSFSNLVFPDLLIRWFADPPIHLPNDLPDSTSFVLIISADALFIFPSASLFSYFSTLPSLLPALLVLIFCKPLYILS